MAFTVVLDTCVLFPFSLRDTLLRMAERELYVARWSDRILEEMRSNLVGEGIMGEEKALAIVRLMHEYFPEAVVAGDAVARLEPSMSNDPKDAHVLAAAFAGSAEGIVTFNLDHFPEEACAPFGVTALHPDDFLLTLHDIAPAVAAEVVTNQAADLANPPLSREELLGSLRRAGIPRFADAVAG